MLFNKKAVIALPVAILIPVLAYAANFSVDWVMAMNDQVIQTQQDIQVQQQQIEAQQVVIEAAQDNAREHRSRQEAQMDRMEGDIQLIIRKLINE